MTAMTKAAKRERPVIAIDGPAGAGKSTMAAHLARRFGFLNLETGAMYRALALKAIEHDLGFEDEAALLDLADQTRITLQPQMEGNVVLLDGVDVSRRLREKDVTSAASQVSVHPRLRVWMVEQQRQLGAAGGVGMEGVGVAETGVHETSGSDVDEAVEETAGTPVTGEQYPEAGLLLLALLGPPLV